MKSEELYINKQRVDLGSGNITLKFQSNFLGDIAKIQTNFSHTISVPKTANNTRIFELSDMPSIAGTAGYGIRRQFANARYLRNGIEILNGNAILMSATDKSFDLCLNWGDLLELVRFLSYDFTLNNAFSQSYVLKWHDNSISDTYINAPSGFFGYYAGFYDFDINTSPHLKINVHPSVRVSHLIEAIQQMPMGQIPVEDELTFLMHDGTNLSEQFEDVALLCMTKKQTKEAIDANPLGISSSYADTLSFNSPYNYYRLRLLSEIKNPFFETYTIPNAPSRVIVRRNINTLELSFNVRIDTVNNITGNAYFIVSKSDTETGAANTNNDIYRIRMNVNGNSATISNTTTINKNFAENDKFYFFIAVFGGGYTRITANISINSIWDENETTPDVEYPGMFPVYANLPDINFIDFIKALCWMKALFAYRKNDDPNTVIRFAPVELLYSNKPNAYNWSNKMINRQKPTPKHISYKYGNMAQNNILKYKEDEFNSQTSIDVDDATLPQNADFITLPFAASIESENKPMYVNGTVNTPCARINQYSKNENDELEFSVLEPRILRISKLPSNNNIGILRFYGIEFSRLKQTYYQKYQELVRRPVVIKEQFIIPEHELKNIDFSIPVYLSHIWHTLFCIISL